MTQTGTQVETDRLPKNFGGANKPSKSKGLTEQFAENMATQLLAKQLREKSDSPICQYIDRLVLNRETILWQIESGRNPPQALIIYRLFATNAEKRRPGSFMEKMIPEIRGLCSSDLQLNSETITAFYEFVLKSIK